MPEPNNASNSITVQDSEGCQCTLKSLAAPCQLKHWRHPIVALNSTEGGESWDAFMEWVMVNLRGNEDSGILLDAFHEWRVTH